MEGTRFLRVRELQRELGWGRWKVNRLLREGKLAYHQEADGGPILIERQSLDKYLETIRH